MTTSFPTSVDPLTVPDRSRALGLTDPQHGQHHQNIADTTKVIERMLVGPTWFNVKSDVFGAMGDGTADDSGAIQGALDAAVGGGTVYFPPGTYRVDSSLGWSLNADTNRPVSLLGSGPASILKTSNAIPIFQAITTTSNIRRLRIEALQFYLNNAGATGIKGRLMAYCVLHDLDFLGPGTGIDLGNGGAGDLGNQLSDIRMTQVGRGVLINGRYNIITNLVIGEGITGADALNITGASNLVSGFVIRGNGGTGGTAAVVVNGEGTTLTNGRIFDSYANGLDVLTGPRDVKIVGVHIDNSQNHGLNINGGLQGYYQVTFTNSGLATADTYHHVKLLNSATDNTIIAEFVGTAALNDVNDSGNGTNNIYILGAPPNGLAITGPNSMIMQGGLLATGRGATGARPSSPQVASQWFDTTLGIPIWWNGSVWKNAAGTTV